MSPIRVLALASVLALGACKTQEQRQAEKDAATVDEVCALPKEQRDAELKRIKAETGMVIYCGKTAD